MIPPARGIAAPSSVFIGWSNESSTTPIIASDQVPTFRNLRMVPIEDMVMIALSAIGLFSCVFHGYDDFTLGVGIFHIAESLDNLT